MVGTLHTELRLTYQRVSSFSFQERKRLDDHTVLSLLWEVLSKRLFRCNCSQKKVRKFTFSTCCYGHAQLHQNVVSDASGKGK